MKEMSTEEKKKILRQSAREKEQLLSQEEKMSSDAKICQRLFALEEYKSASTVFCYVGTEHEIKTTEFILGALSLGKCVGVPLCLGQGVMEVRKITSMEDLSLGYHGLQEPNSHLPLIEPSEIDFAVLPCTTCDKSGYRLGKGGGYYDRYLPKLRCACAVVCRGKLISENIPAEPHDCLLYTS